LILIIIYKIIKKSKEGFEPKCCCKKSRREPCVEKKQRMDALATRRRSGSPRQEPRAGRRIPLSP